MRNIKLLFKITAISIAIFINTLPLVFASSSSNFHLDYTTINTGATQLSSNDYVVKAGVAAIETNGFSTAYNLATINKFDSRVGYCGDGIIQSWLSEQCDTSNLNSKTCSDFGFNQGSLSCNACNFDTSNCSNSSGGGVGSIIPIPVYPPEEGEIANTNFNIDLPNNYNLFDEIVEDIVVEDLPIEKILYKTNPSHEAANEDSYKNHLDEYLIGETIQTNDQTPVITEILDKNTVYYIFTEDSDSRIAKIEEVKTDNEGDLLYEIPSDLDIGNYLITILNKEKEEKQFFNLEILKQETANKNSELKVSKIFNTENPKQSFNEFNDLDIIEKTKTDELLMELNPNTYVYIYIKNNDGIKVEKILSNEDGKVAYDLSKLNYGDYELNIVQTYNERVQSENIKYKFTLVDLKPVLLENINESTSYICPEIQASHNASEDNESCYPVGIREYVCRLIPLIIVLIILAAILFPIDKKKK